MWSQKYGINIYLMIPRAERLYTKLKIKIISKNTEIIVQETSYIPNLLIVYFGTWIPGIYNKKRFLKQI